MIRIEPREAPSRLLTIGIPVLSAMLALLLAAIPLTFAGANIGEAYQSGSQRSLTSSPHNTLHAGPHRAFPEDV